MTVLSKMTYLFTYLLIATCFISDVYGRGDGALKQVLYAAIIEDARIETNSLKSPTMDALIQGNGDIHSLVYALFDGFGHYTEMFAATGAISELLLQSVDNIVRVFPAWPREKDAEFTTLRARGGFLVSSQFCKSLGKGGNLK